MAKRRAPYGTIEGVLQHGEGAMYEVHFEMAIMTWELSEDNDGVVRLNAVGKFTSAAKIVPKAPKRRRR